MGREGRWRTISWVSLAAGVGLALVILAWPEWFFEHVPEQMSRFVSALIPLAAGGSVFLVRWLVSPYFVHKELTKQLKGKPRREIARRIIEEVKVGGTGPFATTYRDPMIVRLISASEDFGDESDVEEVCAELRKGGHDDPFEEFEVYYGAGAFKDKRLRFLRDARFASVNIRDDQEALSYLRSWAESNGLKEVPSSEILASDKSIAILWRNSIRRLKRRFLSGK